MSAGGLRVHQFARLRGVSINTVWDWIREGKVAAEKDEGGHRWLVFPEKTPGNTGKEQETPGNTV